MSADPQAEKDAEVPPGSSGRAAWRRWLVPGVMVLVVVAFGFPALDQYNVTWDEALGDFFFGERYLSFFTSFDPVYLDFRHDPYPPDRVPDLSVSPFTNRPHEYYPVANVAAAATSTVLSRWLGWLDPFDGFHAVNLLFAAVLIVPFYRFLEDRADALTAVATMAVLFCSPRIVCHLMANIKDFPLMALYTATVVAFFRAWRSSSVGGLLGTGVLWGLTLGTKANALFLPGIPALVLLFGGWPEAWRGRRAKLIATLVALGVIGVAVMVLTWPYLWPDPLGRFAEHLRYIGYRKHYIAAVNTAPVLRAILVTTPPAFLAFFGVGFGICLRRVLRWSAARRDGLALILLAWVAIVLGRYLLPQAVNFDGVRHFLELFPAMAAIAGIGVAGTVRLLIRLGTGASERLAGPLRRWAPAAVVLLATLPGAWAVLRTHPFEIVYWNVFAGGFAGAYQRGEPQASDYWGMSYRQGLEWLDENAEENSYLVVPVIEHAVRLVAPQRLRSDIELLPVTLPYSPRIDPERLRRTRELAREAPVYAMFVERREWLNEVMLDCLLYLRPEVVWEVEGAPVLWIFRYRPPPGGTSPGRTPAPPAAGSPGT